MQLKKYGRTGERFRAAELIQNYNLKKKEFDEISTDHFHLLYDQASDIASLKAQFGVLFSYFDLKKRDNKLAEKLPWSLKDK